MKPVDGLQEISLSLRRLADDLKSRPLATAQSCELQLETCMNRLRDLLRDNASVRSESAGVIRSIRGTLLEMNRHINLLRQINAGLVTLQTSHVNGYDAAGRPASYRSGNQYPR